MGGTRGRVMHVNAWTRSQRGIAVAFCALLVVLVVASLGLLTAYADPHGGESLLRRTEMQQAAEVQISPLFEDSLRVSVEDLENPNAQAAPRASKVRLDSFGQGDVGADGRTVSWETISTCSTTCYCATSVGCVATVWAECNTMHEWCDGETVDTTCGDTCSDTCGDTCASTCSGDTCYSTCASTCSGATCEGETCGWTTCQDCPSSVEFYQVAGTSRYETAVAASEDGFPEGLDPEGNRLVVIATGRNWPDALGGTALAGILGGPMLLTEPDSIPDVVMQEIDRLGAVQAIILGGSDVVGPAVESVLVSKFGAQSVERIAGKTRYETADLIASKVIELLGENYDGVAFVATGAKFPDALAAGPLAAYNGWPLFLAHPREGLLPAAKARMGRVSRALILGGPDVVGASTESYLSSTLGADNVTRLAGTSRYQTAAIVAAYGVNHAGMQWRYTGLATGQKFPDALAGGVSQAQWASVMLLTRSDSLDSATKNALTANKSSIEQLFFFGSTGALSNDVRMATAQALE